MGKKHSEGTIKVLFCTLRTGKGQKCHCPNDYVANCPPPKWSAFKYRERQRPMSEDQKKAKEARDEGWEQNKHKYPSLSKKGKPLKRKWKRHLAKIKIVQKSFAAHHLVSVASVTKFIAEEVDFNIIAQTNWCVNYENNMIALPMWGHTIRWYCRLSHAVPLEEMDGKMLREKIKPPPFRNLPMHDSDHRRYCKEVDKELKKIRNNIKKNAKNHKDSSNDLLAALNRLVRLFKLQVERKRGRRCADGTHEAWEKGKKGDPKWYLSFSMAKKATKRTFPFTGANDRYMEKKIRNFVYAHWGIA